MDRFERVNSVYRLLVATVVAAVSTLIFDRLQTIFRDRSLVWIILLALIAVVLFTLNQVFEALLEHSVSIRKLLAGNEFIEGFWFDISIDRANKTVHHGSFITIWWENGRFAVSGIEFDPEGTRLCTFKSTSTAFADRILTFGYQSHGDTFAQAIESGIDQLQFDSPPQSYSGFYLDFTKTVDVRVQGSKIDQRTVNAYNGFRDVASRQRFILEQIAIAQKHLMSHT